MYEIYLKIWIDILTPKQLLFAEPLVEKLSKKHQILCTSRSYEEVIKLAKIREFSLIYVGKYGGKEKFAKLGASIFRMKKLVALVHKFSPELTISFCSPEAARISFGLGIKHVAFCDSPHASAVMRLTLPLIQKILIPWIIPKKEFSKYGIQEKNIIPYRAIDAAITIKRKTDQRDKIPFKRDRKNILIRAEEEEAAYTSKSNKIIPIINKIVEKYGEENIVVLGRYNDQIRNLQKIFDKKIIVRKMSFDGKILLENADMFIGSGGTMTAESALLGVPTISYNAVPNIVENYLVKNNLVIRETNPERVVGIIEKEFGASKKIHKSKVKKILKSMDDPIQKLIQIIDE
jgi:predicted glycosyltransferase